MKDITLKITGKQCFENKEEDQMEFITDGKIYVRNDSLYMVYDESEISGMSGCKTTLKIKGDTVKMKRMGEMGYGTELYFEKGKRMLSTYETPMGPMGIEVFTKCVTNNMDMDKLSGDIDIQYDVSLEGLAEGRNRLTIAVS